jgi:hypothetical protein
MNVFLFRQYNKNIASTVNVWGCNNTLIGDMIQYGLLGGQGLQTLRGTNILPKRWYQATGSAVTQQDHNTNHHRSNNPVSHAGHITVHRA